MNGFWWWLLALTLIIVGVIGTFLPVLPGAALVFGGMLLAAWIDDFQRIGWITLTILGALTVLVFVIDIVAALLGAKRVGASRLAISLWILAARNVPVIERCHVGLEYALCNKCESLLRKRVRKTLQFAGPTVYQLWCNAQLETQVC
jgi:hypothetical protein